VVSYQGALACKSTIPRYIDDGDGTVTDNQTGLMWEKKTSTCSGEVTCVNNAYSWSLTGTPADGTLFTTFIAGLNGGTTTANPRDKSSARALGLALLTIVTGGFQLLRN
jgi:hypothetical protein